MTVGQLIRVCTALQISGPGNKNVASKSRSQLIFHIIKHLEREELTDLNVQDIIDKIQNEIPNQTDEQEKMQKEDEALRLSLEEKENAMRDLINRNKNPSSGVSTPVKNMILKDFKIAGQIGEKGQNDKLTFFLAWTGRLKMGLAGVIQNTMSLTL